VALKTIGNYIEDGNLGFFFGFRVPFQTKATTPNPNRTLKMGGKISTSVPPFSHSRSKRTTKWTNRAGWLKPTVVCSI